MIVLLFGLYDKKKKEGNLFLFQIEEEGIEEREGKEKTEETDFLSSFLSQCEFVEYLEGNSLSFEDIVKALRFSIYCVQFFSSFLYYQL
jgi:hypothetical protein